MDTIHRIWLLYEGKRVVERERDHMKYKLVILKNGKESFLNAITCGMEA